MNFIDRVTGNDMTREYRAMELRVKKLPAEYQKAWADIKTHLWPYSDLTGRNLMAIGENALALLEEAAADNQSVKEVFGNDIAGFVTALAGGDGAKNYRDKWRDQLNKSVEKKLGKESK
jgi:DNA-binding ferritin-like protein (Dps family)